MNDSSNICAIEKILSSPVHLLHIPSPVPSPCIFTYGTASDPRSPSHDSSVEIVAHKSNPTSFNKPPNMLPKVPYDPD